ncbi:MAG: hypothetical protein M3O86_02375 [Actinomycetota bacterium]|nr:hypothetical protein [Actinomycetota bacterium]
MLSRAGIHPSASDRLDCGFEPGGRVEGFEQALKDTAEDTGFTSKDADGSPVKQIYVGGLLGDPGPAVFTATGTIVGSNRASKAVSGATEAEFASICDRPRTQGVDGYVFRIPENLGAGDASARVAGAPGALPHDLDFRVLLP